MGWSLDLANGRLMGREVPTGRQAVARLLACALAVSGGVITPIVARAGVIERTAPGHLPPVPPGGYQLPMAPPVMRFPLPPQWVTIQSSQDWRKAGGTVDKELSDACALGRFTEILPMRYRAVFRQDVFGVAFGHGLNLNDPGKKAKRNMIYMFRNGDSTNCLVLRMTNRDARILAESEGTTPPSLPGPDGRVAKDPAKSRY